VPLTSSKEQPTILIVEDEPLVRNMMVIVLADKGYRMLEADGAAGALTVSNTFDGVINLLITDHSLETMTGRQLAEQIRQSRPDMKVLHVSGYLREKLEQEAGLMPGASFLSKPFLPGDLTKKVKEVLVSGPE